VVLRTNRFGVVVSAGSELVIPYFCSLDNQYTRLFMSVLVDKKTRLLVQGITGSEGGFHTEQMIEYGTKVVAGVTPGKGGTTHLGVPVFNTVADAVKETGANARAFSYPHRSPPMPSWNPLRAICRWSFASRKEFLCAI